MNKTSNTKQRDNQDFVIGTITIQGSALTSTGEKKAFRDCNKERGILGDAVCLHKSTGSGKQEAKKQMKTFHAGEI